MPVRLVANSEGARPCGKHQPQQCNSFCGWVSPQPRSTDALAANRIGTGLTKLSEPLSFVAFPPRFRNGERE